MHREAPSAGTLIRRYTCRGYVQLGTALCRRVYFSPEPPPVISLTASGFFDRLIEMLKKVQFPVPIFINREGKWFIAECPVLNLATQGKTEKEARENMKELLQDYLRDEDTPKDFLRQFYSRTLTYIPVAIPANLL